MGMHTEHPTTIEQNPFAVLGLSTRDDRYKIIEVSEEMSLSLDSDACAKARADLTSPRNRLAIEIAWLPGVSPKKAKELLSVIRSGPDALLNQIDIEPLALANLVASAIEILQERLGVDEWSAWILKLAKTFEAIVPEKVLRDINEDRSVSGFQEIKKLDQIEKEIINRRRLYKEVVRNALDRLDSRKLVEVVTSVVNISTEAGTKHALILIDDVVDAYQLETQAPLQKGIDKVFLLIKKIRAAASNGEVQIMPAIDVLKNSIAEWDNIAQPIQLSLKSRGLDHDLSFGLAGQIRSLAVDLTNEHGFLEATRKITDLLKQAFAELPEFSAKLEEDVEALDDLFKQRDKDKEDDASWSEEISYEIELGTIFKKKFSISPNGISWKNHYFNLEEITRVRWGGVKTSINFIPTGTNYTIAFGNNTDEAVIELNNQRLFSAIIQRLWKAVCVRLMMVLVQTLKEGNKLKFGDAVIDDEGVELTKHKVFSSERSYWKWGQIHTWTSDGNFIIGAVDDKKSYSQISYLTDANAHVIETCISVALKNWKGSLSASLN